MFPLSNQQINYSEPIFFEYQNTLEEIYQLSELEVYERIKKVTTFKEIALDVNVTSETDKSKSYLPCTSTEKSLVLQDPYIERGRLSEISFHLFELYHFLVKQKLNKTSLTLISNEERKEILYIFELYKIRSVKCEPIFKTIPKKADCRYIRDVFENEYSTVPIAIFKKFIHKLEHLQRTNKATFRSVYFKNICFAAHKAYAKRIQEYKLQNKVAKQLGVSSKAVAKIVECTKAFQLERAKSQIQETSTQVTDNINKTEKQTVPIKAEGASKRVNTDQDSTSQVIDLTGSNRILTTLPKSGVPISTNTNMAAQPPQNVTRQPIEIVPTQLGNLSSKLPSNEVNRAGLVSVPIQKSPSPPPKPPPVQKCKPPPVQKSKIFPVNYPKGIPRSFLKNSNNYQQPASTNMQTFAPTPTFTPYHDMNIHQPNNDMFVQTDQPTSEVQQSYSPTDMYNIVPQATSSYHEKSQTDEEMEEESEERVSAFRRLGPAAKKPRLTINLLFSRENAVREVIDLDTLPKIHAPVWERKDILSSTNDTVIRFLPFWPWKKTVGVKKTVTARYSKSVMLMEFEQMEEAYNSSNQFIKISVKGYPPTFKKEDVLDSLLETLKGKICIPLFTEFTNEECYFLLLRSRGALGTFHHNGLVIQKAGLKMTLSISVTDLTLNHIDFIPRIILRKMLMTAYNESEGALELSEFCLASDISHFIYFPLYFMSNQTLLTQLAKSCIAWDQLRSLNLSGNKITTLEGFDLVATAPKLKHLDLSNNHLEKLAALLPFKGLQLKSLKLEGNPLCIDYTDPDQYVKVAKMIFPSLCELDGVEIPRKGVLAPNRGNYCTHDAEPYVSAFLKVLTPLWSTSNRHQMLPMYHQDTTLSVTYDPNLRYTPTFRIFRSLFSLPCKNDREIGSVTGASNIIKQIMKWPAFQMDPYSTLVDVMFSNEQSLIMRINGVFKLAVDTLAENEPLLHYTRTLVMSAGVREWRIDNEMIYWAQPTAQCEKNAFRITTVEPQLQLTLKLETPPDEELKENLISIFMNITKLNKKRSQRCLEIKDWDIKGALEHFMKLLKLNTIHSLDYSNLSVQ